jgi:hypothetical protein
MGHVNYLREKLFQLKVSLPRNHGRSLTLPWETGLSRDRDVSYGDLLPCNASWSQVEFGTQPVQEDKIGLVLWQYCRKGGLCDKEVEALEGAIADTITMITADDPPPVLCGVKITPTLFNVLQGYIISTLTLVAGKFVVRAFPEMAAG